MNTSLLPVASIAGTILVADQITKFVVVKKMPLHTSIYITPFFSFTHVQNTGAAFGIFPNANVFFIVVAFLILTGLAILHKRLAHSKLTVAALGLLWGGAVGNLIDRIARGSVVDFLDFHIKTWHWPAFNVADSAICVSVFLLLLDGFFQQGSKTQPMVNT